MYNDVIIIATVVMVAIFVIAYIQAKARKIVNTEYIDKEEFETLKNKCQDCREKLPEKYVLKTDYIRDLDTTKGGLKDIWEAIEKLNG